MAGEQQNQQSGQQQGSQSSGAEGSNDGSNQANQNNQQQANAGADVAPVRPAALADKAFDAYWDAKAGIKHDVLAKDFNDLRASKAQTDLRLAGVPKSPDDYKLALPQTYKAPVGPDGKPLDVKIDEADPRLPAARAWAHKFGLDQNGFSELLSIQVQADLADQQLVASGRAKEQEKLGVNGPARVDAIETWLTSKLGSDKGGALFARLTLSTDVEAMEDLINQFSTQGGGAFNQQHRDNGGAGKLTEEEYQKLPLSERRQYQLNGGVQRAN